MLTTAAEDFEQAFLRYHNELYGFLLRRTRSHSDAEELTQQAFADAASAIARSRSPRSMRRWLFTVAERRFVDEVRRRKRLAVLGDVEQVASDEGEAPSAVGDVLGRLPELQRQIVVMRVLQGHSYREIARALDSDEATCRTRFSRALNRLRDELNATSSRN